jgi:hypothetical protein
VAPATWPELDGPLLASGAPTVFLAERPS